VKKGAFVIAFFLIIAQGSFILLLLRGNISLQKFSTQLKIQNLPEEKIATDTLLIHPDEVKWEHDKEFWLNGQLYDVISKTQKGKLLEIVAYHDLKEQKAKESYRVYAKHRSRENISAGIPIPDFRMQVLFCYPFSKVIHNTGQPTGMLPYHFAIKEAIQPTITPPPVIRT